MQSIKTVRIGQHVLIEDEWRKVNAIVTGKQWVNGKHVPRVRLCWVDGNLTAPPGRKVQTNHLPEFSRLMSGLFD